MKYWIRSSVAMKSDTDSKKKNEIVGLVWEMVQLLSYLRQQMDRAVEDTFADHQLSYHFQIQRCFS